MTTATLLLLPPALTLGLAVALRLLLKDAAARVAAVPLIAGILLCWAFVVRPGWMPVDDVRRVVHIAAGAAVLALLLDAFRPGRIAAVALTGVFVLASAFAAVTGLAYPRGPVGLRTALVTVLVAAVAALVLARVAVMRARPFNLVLLLALLAAGLTVLAAIAQDRALAGLALVMAAALAGQAVFVAATGTAAGGGIVLAAGAPMLAMVWALAQRHPDLRLALLVLPLVLFAEPTARRVPLPAARISAILSPAIFALLVGLPLALAALIAFVTSAP